MDQETKKSTFGWVMSFAGRKKSLYIASVLFAAVLFRRFHADKFETVAANFTACTKVFGRNKGASDQVEFVKVSNPFGILFISFLTFDGFDIFRMSKANINVVFKVIKNRNPILAGGFHADMITMIFDKPIVKLLNIRVDGRKRSLYILRYSLLVGRNNSSNDNVFVDIKSAADGVF